MDKKSILGFVAEYGGIREINAMQAAAFDCESRNVILLSPTGSGKTLAFVMALLRRMETARTGTGTQAVVLTPSRELTMQVYEVMRKVARGFKTMALYGGHSMEAEVASIGGAVPDIVVATPGRFLDHMERNTLDAGRVRLMVIDEYDKALELGFCEQMGKIARRTARRTFTMLTSATPLAEIPPFIHASEAEIIDFSDSVPAGGKVTVVTVPSPVADKLETLGALLRNVDKDRPTMVFVNHRQSAERVERWLRKHGVSAILYHGGLDQRQREIAVAALASGAAPVMVTTDLGGRGLDIDNVGAVVHYHLPVDEKTYTHRNGRTARAGASGDVYVITGPDEYAPDFIVSEREYYPDMTATERVDSDIELLYISAGKRQKISRGDVAGFVMKSAGVAAADVGKIFVGSDYALVAVHGHKNAGSVMDAARRYKLKGQKVRITPI